MKSEMTQVERVSDEAVVCHENKVSGF